MHPFSPYWKNVVDTNYSIQKTIHSESDLSLFSQSFAPHITPNIIIGLIGDMGAGKTTFIRLLGQALGSNDWINSPTYSIIQTYVANQLSIIHVDLYRCMSDLEIEQLDLFSMLNDQSILIIEWIDNTTLFSPDILIKFNYLSDQSRTLTITSNKHSFIDQL